MTKILLISCFLGMKAFALDYLKEVKGVVLDGLTQRLGFVLQPGTLHGCVPKAYSSFTTYECEVNGGAITIEANQIVQKAIVNKVFLFSRGFTKARQFIFHGAWKEEAKGISFDSPMKLSLWYYDENPTKVEGTLSLTGLNISSGLIGHQNLGNP